VAATAAFAACVGAGNLALARVVYRRVVVAGWLSTCTASAATRRVSAFGRWHRLTGQERGDFEHDDLASCSPSSPETRRACFHSGLGFDAGRWVDAYMGRTTVTVIDFVGGHWPVRHAEADKARNWASAAG
jgi:hypothetical protein